METQLLRKKGSAGSAAVSRGQDARATECIVRSSGGRSRAPSENAVALSAWLVERAGVRPRYK